MDKRRIIFASIFLVVCILVAFLIYWVFFKEDKPKPITTSTGTTPTGQFPTAGEGGETKPTITEPDTLPTAGTIQPTITQNLIKKQVKEVEEVIDTYTIDPTVDKNGNIKFYNNVDGKFYKTLADGSVKELDDTVFYNVEKVTWSPSKNESILEYPDGSNIYYNFDTKNQVTLPKHWEEFSFSPQGDKIASKSMGLSEENRWLVTADPTGKSISLVEPMGQNADKVIVDWSPNQQIVGMSLTGRELGADRQEVLFVGLNGENFRSTIIEGRDPQTKWSTEGKKLLYSVHSARTDFKPELWIVNAEGDSIGTGRKMLGLNTWAEKCTFSDERYAYCGVPIALDNGAGFAPGLADGTPDKFYKIDLQTGLKTEIPTSGYDYTVDSMFIGEDNETLYFTDKLRPGLFSLAI